MFPALPKALFAERLPGFEQFLLEVQNATSGEQADAEHVVLRVSSPGTAVSRPRP